MSRKNVFLWLACAAFLASMVLRIIHAGFRTPEVTPRFWMVVLPCVSSFLFISILLISGEELLYRTAVPFNLGVLYFVIRVFMYPYNIRIQLLYTFVYLVIGMFYYEVLSGNFGRRLLLGVVLLAALCSKLWSFIKRFGTVPVSHPVMSELPDILLIGGAFFVICAMSIHLDGKFHPTWGDRADGRRIRSLGVVTQVSAFIMKTRQDASNHIQDTLEITELEDYISRKKAEGYKNMSLMHLFLAAYVRAVAKYPGINRFLSGQRVYSRGDDIQFCMVVKSSMTMESEESVMKLHLSPADTVFDVYEKMDKEIQRIKKTPVGSSDFDKVAKLFYLTPRFLLRFIIWAAGTLDYYGMLPKFLLEVSPFHASMFLTSMASLGINPVVHHLYEFGNLPVFCSLGARYVKYEPDKEGNIVRHRYLDYTFNTDERIVDGFYYASVFKYIKKLLSHPEKLENPPQEINSDIL